MSLQHYKYHWSKCFVWIREATHTFLDNQKTSQSETLFICDSICTFKVDNITFLIIQTIHLVIATRRGLQRGWCPADIENHNSCKTVHAWIWLEDFSPSGDVLNSGWHKQSAVICAAREQFLEPAELWLNKHPILHKPQFLHRPPSTEATS